MPLASTNTSMMAAFVAHILLSQLLLAAPVCTGLTPLLGVVAGGGKNGIVGGTIQRRSFAIDTHIHRQQLSRNRHSELQPRSTSTTSYTHLSMIGSGYHSPEPSEQPQQQQTKRKRQWAEYITPDLDVPTITQQDIPPISQIPPRPKIVIFGASGRIGRRILKKLLVSNVDMDVVAFVRDRSKLERVLYHEEDLILDNLIFTNGKSSSAAAVSGPKLHIVESDVVSQRDVYQKEFETADDKHILDAWVDKAKSYFDSMGWNYDVNSTTTTTADMKTFEDETKIARDVDIIESGGEEALRDVISGSTVLISCLATFRPSNVWTDYVKVPILRVFRSKHVDRWCDDALHPYYVNYLSTKKILRLAEEEQGRRDVLLELERERQLLEEERTKRRRQGGGIKEEEGFESEIAARLAELRRKRSASSSSKSSYSNGGDDVVRLPKSGQRPSPSDRIKFIRISHLMVGHNPFRVWNVLTNIFWSQLSKFELMAEMLMEGSKLVDTIVLRPGDLTDDERNANHTSLQLCIDGNVDSPSVVGREDVADLAVVSALTKTSVNETKSGNGDSSLSRGNNNNNNNPTTTAPASAHHYTWAMRWTGQYLNPPQGLRPDGLSNAALCFIKAIKEQTELDTKRKVKERRLKSYHGGKELIRFKKWRRRLKPSVQSLAIAVPVYATLGLLTWYAFGQTIIELFVRLKRLSMPQMILKFLP